MRMRPLGDNNLQIAPVMLGGNVFGWTVDEATSFGILDAFVDRGFNAIDTADMYSRWVPGHEGGESETIIGAWLAQGGRRDRVVLATKVGMDMGGGKKGLKAAYIKESVESSLRRLRTDRIDLYQSHQDDESTPVEETLKAFDDLIQAGKVRYVGASNFTGSRLAQAMEAGPARYVTLQPKYNLHARQDYETDLAPVAAKYGLGVIPYSSLASGFLTGKYRTREDANGVPREGNVRKGFDGRGEKILQALAAVSASTGAAQATIALAWLLAQPNIAAPIASATSIGQLESLLAAGELELPAEHMTLLTEASSY